MSVKLIKLNIYHQQCRDFHVTSAAATIANGRRFLKRRWLRIDKPCTDPKQAELDHFEQEAMKVDFGVNYVAKLTEIFNTKLSVNKALLFKRDDGLIKHDSKYWLPDIDQTQIKHDYANVECLKTAPDVVRKMFSIKFGERGDLYKAYKKDFIDKFKHHELDNQLSLETAIAGKTAEIRFWTQRLEESVTKPGYLRSMIFMAIGKRRKLLRILRQQDTQTFDRIMKELKIAYYVPPNFDELRKFSRKGWITEITKAKLEKLQEERLRQYHAELKAKHETFVEKRDETRRKLLAERRQLRNELLALRDEFSGALNVVGKYTLDNVSEVSENGMLYYFYLQNDAKKKERMKNYAFDDDYEETPEKLVETSQQTA